MNEEVKVKRPRGNPNFVKKNKPAEQVEPGTAVLNPTTQNSVTYKYQYVETEGEVWLKLFAAMLVGSSTSQSSINQAAVATDSALAEYKKRYSK